MNGAEQSTNFVGEFVKVEPDQQLAFGWAYVASEDGVLVHDHSGDFVDSAALPDLEKAAYEYVLESREGDEMHVTTTGIAKLVESVLVTPEKLAAMGLQGTRTGWWVGFKVQDPEVWAKVKSGEYPAFSIRGVGFRDEED